MNLKTYFAGLWQISKIGKKKAVIRPLFWKQEQIKTGNDYEEET